MIDITKITDTRAIAAKLITAVVIDQVSLTTLFADQSIKTHPQLSFIKALCFGVLRWYSRLSALQNLLLAKPLPSTATDVHALLCIGLFQLLESPMPAHAVVSATVNAAKTLKKPWAPKLVNAVLRNFLRQKTDLLAKIARSPTASFSHPQWLIAAIQTAWPAQWENVLNANNQLPPLWLRINVRRTTRSDYLTLLKQQNIAADVNEICPSAIIIREPLAVEQLPGFAAGLLSVQDGAAQLATGLLQLQPQLRVLDACAAPGGKTTHILETMPGLASLIAIEQDPARVLRIKENLQRLQLEAEVICADVIDTSAWWDGKTFDRILLDAPCSATGVIRRHPDIKWLRHASDIAALAQQQFTMMQALWGLLKPEGILLYATCSILPNENDSVIAKFLENTADAKLLPISANWGVATNYGRQILPGMDAMDGFYYARLQKTL